MFWILLIIFGFHDTNICHGKSIEVHEIRNTKQMPDADGNLNVYILPIGQGDGHVIQCPSGDLSIIDLGASNPTADGFWLGQDVAAFLTGREGLIRNFLMTHNHYDHYSRFPYAYPTPATVPNLQNIYISCLPEHMATTQSNWIMGTAFESLLTTFNNGLPCGPIGTECGFLDLCPSDQQVTAKVMGVNLGQHCTSGNKNMDSIVFKLEYGSVSMLFTGDFEDETTNWEEDGPQKWMVDFYGSELISTVYKISHHGASNLANKPVFRDAVQPKALFACADAFYNFPSGYGHPRCTVIDAFINYVGTLCVPGETDTSSPQYCGAPLTSHSTQTDYQCGASSTEILDRTGNQYAIYTNTPSETTMNLVTFNTDGTRWQFASDVTPRLSRK